MTDNIEWGEPLSGDVIKALRLPGNTGVQMKGFDGESLTPLADLHLDSPIPVYKLPAEHPAYIVAAHNAKHGTNFVYWDGGGEEPKDVGDRVLYRDGSTHDAVPGLRWDYWSTGTDIIGYTRKTNIHKADATLDLTKPVQTRDGKPVRILCTDGPNDHYPVAGWAEGERGPNYWALDGRYHSSLGHMNGKDLINVPERVVEWFGLHPSEGAYGREERSHVAPDVDFHLRITWTEGVPEARVFAADEEDSEK